MSETQPESTETDPAASTPDTAATPATGAAGNTAGVAPADNPHAASVLTLAAAMLKATLVVAPVTILIGLIVFTVTDGSAGLFGALIGGAVALASSLATIALMRFCAGLDPIMVMAVVLGGYVLKVLLLIGLMTLLRGVDGLAPYALGITMLATFVVAAAAEVRAFKRTKIPTLIV